MPPQICIDGHPKVIMFSVDKTLFPGSAEKPLRHVKFGEKIDLSQLQGKPCAQGPTHTSTLSHTLSAVLGDLGHTSSALVCKNSMWANYTRNSSHNVDLQKILSIDADLLIYVSEKAAAQGPSLMPVSVPSNKRFLVLHTPYSCCSWTGPALTSH